MTLNHCQTIIKKQEITDKYFLELHFTTEAIFRRLFFIGLRKKGVFYDTAKKIVNNYYNQKKSSYIDTIFNYCDIPLQDLRNHNNFNVLLELYVVFTTYYRNLRVHGATKPIKDERLLKTLITVDKQFITTLLDFLKSKHKLDIFAKPKDWGIKPGNETDTENIYNSLIGNMQGGKRLKIEEVEERLRQINKV